MKNLCCLLGVLILFVNCRPQEDIKSISTQNLKQLLAKKNIQLLDVRTPNEVNQGSIKTAIFINYFDEDFKEQSLEKLNKTKPVYLYCRTGNRSGKAAKILKENGFEVYNVLGGYTKWKQEN